MYLPACIILSYDVTAAQFARSGDVNIPIQQDVGDADLMWPIILFLVYIGIHS